MLMKTKKIKWLSGEGKFAEDYARGMQYALVNDKSEQVHHFVWCKDFLHDMIFGEINQKNINIYRFTYIPGTDIKPCSKRIRVALANSYDKNFASKIENSLDLINQFEEAIGFIKSQVYQCADPPDKYKNSGVFLFDGSKRWMNAPVMLSAYTLLLRVGMKHQKGKPYMETLEGIANGTIKPYQSNDQIYSKQALPGLKRIVREKPTKIFSRKIEENYPKKLDSSTMHHRFGIVSFSQGTYKNVMPTRWYAGVPTQKD